MTYDAGWDHIHRPGPEPDWQESDCYWFYDREAGVGGFHRIGQKPNRGTGQLTLFAFARDGERYVINDSYMLERPVDASNRWDTGHHIAGHRSESLGDRRMHYSWSDEGCEADLVFGDSFYTPRDWTTSGRGDAVLKNISPGGHLECGGRIRGRIRIGERAYDIDALAHRDRSWGHRDHGEISYHAYRMFSGTVGPPLSFACFILNPRGKPPVVAGFVVRDGREEDVVGLRVLTTVDSDGQTMIEARAELTLAGGETLEVDVVNVQGMMTYFPEADAYVSDNICEVRYGPHVGFCDLEIGINPRQGSLRLDQSDLSLLALVQGLSAFRAHGAR